MEEQIEAVQRMQDYIEAHLEENITLADLAGVSMYSPWYSYRLFVRHAGVRLQPGRIRHESCSYQPFYTLWSQVQVHQKGARHGTGSERHRPVRTRGYIEPLPVKPL